MVSEQKAIEKSNNTNQVLNKDSDEPIISAEESNNPKATETKRPTPSNLVTRLDRSAQAFKKVQNKISEKERKEKYEENMNKLHYYMSIASPKTSIEIIDHEVKDFDKSGKVILDGNKIKTHNEKLKTYVNHGFQYYNIKDESTNGESLDIEDWIKLVFGDKVKLNKDNNTIEIKEEPKEKEKE